MWMIKCLAAADKYLTKTRLQWIYDNWNILLAYQKEAVE